MAMKRTARAVIVDSLVNLNLTLDETRTMANKIVNDLYAEGYLIVTDARGTEW